MSLNLSEKYRPARIADFIGLARPKALMASLAANPYASVWLLVGDSGLGKTTMALALIHELAAELHHIPSRKCDMATVEEVVRSCWYAPMLAARWHVVLVDEADKMTPAAQISFLSLLDATASPPDTIFIFTANSTRLLEPRFRSRCRIVAFTTEGLELEGQHLLAGIFKRETKGTKPETIPDFAGILRENGYNIRASLMTLETEMICPTTPEQRVAEAVVSAPTPAAVELGDEAQKRSDAAKRAWVTIRAKRAAAAGLAPAPSVPGATPSELDRIAQNGVFGRKYKDFASAPPEAQKTIRAVHGSAA